MPQPVVASPSPVPMSVPGPAQFRARARSVCAGLRSAPTSERSRSADREYRSGPLEPPRPAQGPEPARAQVQAREPRSVRPPAPRPELRVRQPARRRGSEWPRVLAARLGSLQRPRSTDRLRPVSVKAASPALSSSAATLRRCWSVSAARRVLVARPAPVAMRVRAALRMRALAVMQGVVARPVSAAAPVPGLAAIVLRARSSAATTSTYWCSSRAKGPAADRDLVQTARSDRATVAASPSWGLSRPLATVRPARSASPARASAASVAAGPLPAAGHQVL